MRRLLFQLPLVAIVAAAMDTVLVRERLPHRDLSAALFLEALLLWLVLGLIALVPTRMWIARRERGDATFSASKCAALLAFFTLAPVFAHGRLNAFSDLGGGLAGLKQARPWLEVFAALALLAALLFCLNWLAARWRASAVAAGLGLAALALGFFWTPARDAPDALNAAAKGKPNLLLLIWDTTRAQSLSIYGYERKTTPQLEKLAAESIVFDKARSASRYTLTSHLSMLTGVYPSDHGARMTRQRISPGKTPSVAANLLAAGYRTAAFVGTGVLTAPTGMSFGFEHYDDLVDPPVCDTSAWALVHDLQSLLAKLGPPLSQNGQPHWFQDFFRPAEEVLGHAARWIDNGDPRPWFCMINLYDVHWPYLPETAERAKWVEAYDGPVDGFHARSDKYPRHYKMQPRDDVHLRELYDAEMAELDRNVDRFLSGLDLARQKTAVLMCADHGEAFGEGGRYEHNDILEPQVRIPFLVRLPGMQLPPKPRSAEPISGVDVAPTLLAIAGLPAPAHYLGINALSVLGAAPNAARPILVEDRDQMHSTDVTLVLYLGQWKLVRRGLGDRQTYQLFDVSKDRLSLEDVAAAHPDLVARLKAELESYRSRWHADDAKDQEGTGYSNADALKNLGYTGN